MPAQNTDLNCSGPIHLTCTSPPPHTEKVFAFAELKPSELQSHIAAQSHTVGEEVLALSEEDNGQYDITAHIPSTATSK